MPDACRGVSFEDVTLINFRNGSLVAFSVLSISTSHRQQHARRASHWRPQATAIACGTTRQFRAIAGQLPVPFSSQKATKETKVFPSGAESSRFVTFVNFC